MSRISIDVSEEEHKRLKALAALRGESIKDFVLSCTLGSSASEDEKGAIDELIALLDARIDGTKKTGVSKRTVDQIFAQACSEANANA